MKNRSVIRGIVLSIITFGFYGLYWEVQTKNEMNLLGADIPTAWYLIIPGVNFYWLWKYGQGVQKVTNGKIEVVTAFLLIWLLSVIGLGIVQNEFNKLGKSRSPGLN